MENFTAKSSDHDSSPSSHKIEAAIWCPVFTIEASVIVIGNLLTVIVFARDSRVRKPSSYLIISLALADLCIGLFVLPLWIYQLTGLGELWHTITFLTVDTFASVASISNLAAISLERLYATMLPWRHRATSKFRVLFFIASIWVLSAVISSSFAVARFAYSSPLGALFSWLPYICLLLLVICGSYSALFMKVRRADQRRSDRERKLTVTLFTATSLSIVAYLPMIVLGVMYFAFNRKMSDLFINILSLFNFGNSLMNPLLYSFRMPDFRKAVCSLFGIRHQDPRTRQIAYLNDRASPLSYNLTAASPRMSPVSRLPKAVDELFELS
ncbi:D(2) dopamine receptor-like [Stylophora pistillata]|uniref:D(2) dopamine receptor-like n=1 Tax=Stylophora pistillata TaxID=50429 RepID=UPI000C0498EE|nr:D(2) dopamine receptor-like [Stylophora pistillata]